MQETLRTDEFLLNAMQNCGDVVYRVAYCRLESRADAEDVYQEVFLHLLRDTTAFRDTEHLKAWLIRTTLNECNDLCRSAWRKRTAPLEDVENVQDVFYYATPVNSSAPMGSIGSEWDTTDDYSELWQAIATLPDDLRTVIYLHYVEGYKTNEIAKLVGCRSITVRTRLHRARHHLKATLKEDNHEESERVVPFAGRQSTR